MCNGILATVRPIDIIDPGIDAILLVKGGDVTALNVFNHQPLHIIAGLV
jgi:hypothetical protein